VTLATVDSSVLVASLLSHDRSHREAPAVLKQILDGEVRAVRPCSVLVEVVAAIRRRTSSGKDALKVEAKLLTFGGILFLDSTRQTARDAARLAAAIGLRGMDALVVQTPIEHQTKLISFDEEMLRKSRGILS
jgi:predicted nucleic acid-binding protein